MAKAVLHKGKNKKRLTVGTERRGRSACVCASAGAAAMDALDNGVTVAATC